MATKPNYFKIGVFVFIAVLLIAGAVIIWGSGVFERERVYFETYIQGSVSGLNVGAPVESQGVKLGRVESINFLVEKYPQAENTQFDEYVMVVGSLDPAQMRDYSAEEREKNVARMVRKGYRLQLSSNLLTGQAYLEGNFVDPNRYPVIPIPWKSEHLYIPSAPGQLRTLKQSLDKVMYSLEQVEIASIAAEFEGLLADVRKAVQDANVGAVSAEAKKLFAEARETNEALKKIIFAADSNKPPTNLAAVLAQLDDTLVKADRTISESGPEIQSLIERVRRILDNIEELTESLKENPSDVIFSRPPSQSEVLQ